MPHEVGATNNGVRVGHAERERSQPFAAQGNDRPKIDQLIRTRILAEIRSRQEDPNKDIKVVTIGRHSLLTRVYDIKFKMRTSSIQWAG